MGSPCCLCCPLSGHGLGPGLERGRFPGPQSTCLGEGRNSLGQLSLHFWQRLGLTHRLLKFLLGYLQ